MFIASENWHNLDIKEAVKLLKTDLDSGLDAQEAERRLAKFGLNAIKSQPPPSPLKLFIYQFNDFLVWILLAAAFISGFLLHELNDALAIAVILILNAFLGFRQEYKAEKALEELRSLSAPLATVIRQGKTLEISADQLVPGDVIEFEAGDRIPADSRIFVAKNLTINESVLTGESVPASKNEANLAEKASSLADRTNMVYTGTTVQTGRGKAIVTATGSQTEIGKIATLIKEGGTGKTPLQAELKSTGKAIAIAVLAISGLVFLAGLLFHHVSASEMFLIAVSLAVAAIPEGLPAAVTFALALGVQEMARNKAIVRRLHAVETLGSTSVICTDKTGTITENQMSVHQIYLSDQMLEIEAGEVKSQFAKNLQLDHFVLASTLCNNARIEEDGRIGDPMELALLEAAIASGYDFSKLRKEWTRIDEIPFDPERKKMSVLVKSKDNLVAYVKGAPEGILQLSKTILTKDGKQPIGEAKIRFLELNNRLAAQGYRVLGFAEKKFNSLSQKVETEEIEKELTFLGLAVIFDPPRPEAAEAVATTRKAGVRIAMITGDHPLTAKAIAKQIGLDTDLKTLTGAELENLSASELDKAVRDTAVYARVSPAHKVKIVEALKKQGAIVAMTGDGVNDAPALKKAHIGIAMGEVGTDVAREAADMVLADDNFATIVKAISQGRHIFNNLKKFILFLLSCNISEVLVLLVSVLFASLPIPLLPIQILWINLVTDGLPALALGADPPEENLMNQPPRQPKDKVLSGKNSLMILEQGLAITFGVTLVFLLSLIGFKDHISTVRTVVFTTMVLAELFHSFNYRSSTKSVFSYVSFKNRFLLLAVLSSIVLQLLIIYMPFLQVIFHTAPLELKDFFLVVFGASLPLLIVNWIKLRRSRQKIIY